MEKKEFSSMLELCLWCYRSAVSMSYSQLKILRTPVDHSADIELLVPILSSSITKMIQHLAKHLFWQLHQLTKYHEEKHADIFIKVMMVDGTALSSRQVGPDKTTEEKLFVSNRHTKDCLIIDGSSHPWCHPLVPYSVLTSGILATMSLFFLLFKKKHKQRGTQAAF